MRYLLPIVAVLVVFGTTSSVSARPRHVPPAPRIVWPVIRAAPAMALVPGSDVWFHTSPQGRIYFHAGAWWWHSAGVWYRSSAYRGPWIVAEPVIVPRAITVLPWDRPVFHPDVRPIHYHTWHGRMFPRPVIHEHPVVKPVPPPPRHPVVVVKHAKPAKVVVVKPHPRKHH